MRDLPDADVVEAADNPKMKQDFLAICTYYVHLYK